MRYAALAKLEIPVSAKSRDQAIGADDVQWPSYNEPAIEPRQLELTHRGTNLP